MPNPILMFIIIAHHRIFMCIALTMGKKIGIVISIIDTDSMKHPKMKTTTFMANNTPSCPNDSEFVRFTRPIVIPV